METERITLSQRERLPQQSQQQSGVLTVRLLFADSLGLDLRRIADPTTTVYSGLRSRRCYEIISTLR
jgi:hypothetical protein